MRLIAALAQIRNLHQAVITVADAAACWGLSHAHSAKTLAQLSQAGHLVRLQRGQWAFPERLEPFALPEYLAAPAPAYVSLHSALFHHGMIAQIPTIIYAVTLERPRRISTPLGVVSLHHVAPHLFSGFEVHGRTGFKLATPEKALFDVLYLATGRSEGLQALPELEFPERFNWSALRMMLRRVRSPQRRQRMQTRLLRLPAGTRRNLM